MDECRCPANSKNVALKEGSEQGAAKRGRSNLSRVSGSLQVEHLADMSKVNWERRMYQLGGTVQIRRKLTEV